MVWIHIIQDRKLFNFTPRKWRKIFWDADTLLISPELAVTPGRQSILHVNSPYEANDKLLFYLALRSKGVGGGQTVLRATHS